MLKRCPSCRRLLPIEEFVRNRSERSGYGAHCRPCHNEITKRNKARRYGGERNYLLRYRYGIDEVRVNGMRAAQGGKCAICRQSAARHVDHCHGSGVVRGLLCFTCNRGLSRFFDDVETLEAAIEYLESHAIRQSDG